LFQPLEMLKQFSSFYDQGHRKIFWGMKLIPVTFPGKVGNANS